MANIRTNLLLGVAAGSLALVSAPLAAQENTVATQAAVQTGTVREQQQYALRLMTQIYDGERDFSHTQMLGIGRIRQGNQSFTQFDYGDGAVVLTGADGQLSASRFLNLSKTEKGILYNYDTRTMAGDDPIAAFHNGIVRPLLGNAPELGSSVSWQTSLRLEQADILAQGDPSLQIEFSRQYFSHGGKPMVLIHYAVPAFSYIDGAGRSVVHWGQGISLTDPGFGMIYLNATLHRSVASLGGATTPYRFARTMVAANPDGSAMLDYRDVPQLAPYIDDLFGADAMRVVHDGQRVLGFDPLATARNLDLIALSIAEDGANEAPMASAAQLAENRGAETLEATGARAMVRDGEVYIDNSSPSAVMAEEAVHTVGGRPGQTSGNLAEEASAETLELLIESSQRGGGLQGNLGDNINSNAVFGNRGDGNNPPPSNLDRAANAGGFLNTVLGYTDKGNAITGGLLATQTVKLTQYANDLGTRLNSASESYRQASARLKQQAKVTLQLVPEADVINTRIATGAVRSLDIERQLDRLSTTMEALTKSGGAIPPQTFAEASRLVTEFNVLQDSMAQDNLRLNAIPDKYKVDFDLSDPFTARLVQNVEDASSDLVGLQKSARAVESEASLLRGLIQRIPTEKIGNALEYFGNSPAGKILDGVSHGMNIYTTTTAINNTINGAYTDQSSGQINLTRDHSISGLALDLTALAGHAVSGNIPAFVSDATAITAGSVADIFLSAKGLRDINALNTDLLRQQRLLQRQLGEKRHKNFLQIGEDLKIVASELDALEEDIENSTGMARDILRQRRAARAEIRRREEAAQREQEAQDRQTANERQARIEENERRRAANERLEESFRPDYPTAPPRDPNTPPREREPELTLEEQGFITETPQQRRLRETREENARVAEELKQYQERLLANRDDNSPFDGDYEMRVSELEVSDLVVSQFEIEPVTFDPVTFDPVTWDPPTWEPPEWVPPEFDPPEISKFPQTDPDDVDGYPGTGEYPAYGFENMSGTLNVDLSRWEDWLATQDIRKLIQLAIAAGYPVARGSDGMATLAIALNDAENIIRQSQNSGYRQWANQAPSCSGYTGCGPQYLERWAMKRSIVALGDILVQSREVFSTGGFSDIGISGFNLGYVLTDFGIEDGDLIDVDIQQFGRRIGGLTGHFLTNAGTSFDVNLRPGVATLVVTALNEGTASPNTAAVTVGNVVRGDGNQTFNLNTGQTATLRIEANATPE